MSFTCRKKEKKKKEKKKKKKKKKKSLYQINQVWQSIEEIKCNGDEESVWSNVFGLKSEE